MEQLLSNQSKRLQLNKKNKIQWQQLWFFFFLKIMEIQQPVTLPFSFKLSKSSCLKNIMQLLIWMTLNSVNSINWVKIVRMRNTPLAWDHPVPNSNPLSTNYQRKKGQQLEIWVFVYLILHVIRHWAPQLCSFNALKSTRVMPKLVSHAIQQLKIMAVVMD